MKPTPEPSSLFNWSIKKTKLVIVIIMIKRTSINCNEKKNRHFIFIANQCLNFSHNVHTHPQHYDNFSFIQIFFFFSHHPCMLISNYLLSIPIIFITFELSWVELGWVKTCRINLIFSLIDATFRSNIYKNIKHDWINSDWKFESKFRLQIFEKNNWIPIFFVLWVRSYVCAVVYVNKIGKEARSMNRFRPCC